MTTTDMVLAGNRLPIAVAEQAEQPAQNAEVYGIDVQAVVCLGEISTDLHVLPWRVNKGMRQLPEIVEILPLVEKMQSAKGLEAGDALAYREQLLELVGATAVDKVAMVAGKVGLKSPRRAIDRKLEQKFPVKANELLAKAQEAVKLAHEDIEFVAGIENPKQQFNDEVQAVAQMVTQSINRERQARVSRGGQTAVDMETPRGLKGLFVKATRAVRGFFGMFKRKREVNREVTAYDAGVGIEQVLGQLRRNSEATKQQLPMLSKLVLGRLPRGKELSAYKLGVLAPEILQFLFSTAGQDEAAKKLMDDVHHNPHEMRFMVNKILGRYGYSIWGIRNASRTLLPAIKDLLPNEGAKVRESYQQILALLQSVKVQSVDKINVDDAPRQKPVKKELFSRLKRLFYKPRHAY